MNILYSIQQNSCKQDFKKNWINSRVIKTNQMIRIASVSAFVYYEKVSRPVNISIILPSMKEKAVNQVMCNGLNMKVTSQFKLEWTNF